MNCFGVVTSGSRPLPGRMANAFPVLAGGPSRSKARSAPRPPPAACAEASPKAAASSAQTSARRLRKHPTCRRRRGRPGRRAGAARVLARGIASRLRWSRRVGASGLPVETPITASSPGPEHHGATTPAYRRRSSCRMGGARVCWCRPALSAWPVACSASGRRPRHGGPVCGGERPRADGRVPVRHRRPTLGRKSSSPASPFAARAPPSGAPRVQAGPSRRIPGPEPRDEPMRALRLRCAACRRPQPDALAARHPLRSR